MSEIPKLALDSEYVAFVRNTDWTFSPIVGNLAFRVETIAGREVLVDPSGHAVTGWGPDGPELSASVVSEVVGSERHGYRASDVQSGDLPTSGSPTANGDSTSRDNSAAVAVPRTQDSPLTRAPSPEQVRKAGLFARPALVASPIANEPTVSIDRFVTDVRAAAERGQVEVGGRLTLDPNWKCWSSTPTARVAR